MKEYANVAKNYGIVEGKVLEYMRESTALEVVYRWAGRPEGGTDWSHMVAPVVIFLTAVSNLYLILKKIFMRYET